MTKRCRPKRNKKIVVWQRDGFRCGYCGRPVEVPCESVPKYLWATVDHKRPLAKGGGNSSDNLLTSCGPCNKRKASQTYERFIASGKASLSFNGGFKSLAQLAQAGEADRTKRGETRGSVHEHAVAESDAPK